MYNILNDNNKVPILQNFKCFMLGFNNINYSMTS